MPAGHCAGVIVVAARGAGGLRLVAVEPDAPGLAVEPATLIDGTRRFATLRFDGVAVGPDAVLATGDGAHHALDAIVARAVTAIAADAVGAAGHALDLSVEYAKQRVQFGRPIGSFQAVKHKLADMFLHTQAASAAVEGAADALDDDVDGTLEHAARPVEVAASYARDAAVAVAGDAVQAHGGIGFTWEHDCHLLLKRTKLDQALLGDPAVHRERLAQLLLEAAQQRREVPA